MKISFLWFDKPKLALLVIFAALITLMVTPDFSLVPANYKQGDIITEDILIKDNLILEDERSTGLRREQAMADFPPIFDYDDRLGNRVLALVRRTFAEMREGLVAMRRLRSDRLDKTRDNSLQQVSLMAAIQTERSHQLAIQKMHNQFIVELGDLGDVSILSAAQRLRMEKLRFDLDSAKTALSASDQNAQQLQTRLDEFKAQGQHLVAELESLQSEEERALRKLHEQFDKSLGISAPPSEFALLTASQFTPKMENTLVALVVPLLSQKIIATPQLLPTERKAIQIQILSAPKVERFDALQHIVDVPSVRDQIAKLGQDLKVEEEVPQLREVVISLGQQLVEPTLTENRGETERQLQEVIKSLSPVYFNLKQGEVVARAGDVATPQQVEVINALSAYKLKNPKYPQLIGTFVLVLITLLLLYELLLQRATEPQGKLSRLLLMAILLMVPLLVAQAILAIAPAWTLIYDIIPSSSYHYFIPAALTAMLAGILLNFEMAVFLGLGTSLFLAVLMGNSFSMFIFVMMGSLVAATPMRHHDTRYGLWQQGLRISVVNMLVLGVMALLNQNPLSWDVGFDMGIGFINGLLLAFMAATLLPLLERAFDITTTMRLQELSKMNHPALKELAVRAPGTYHHSIVVGNLSESAAGGIGANPLLVRVASYYHDLGKMLCPLYFIENQLNKNYHDDLPAKTSTRIILNHVKDGLDLARRHKLGHSIISILAQHHGTSLVRYFYYKAQEEYAALGEEKLEEMEYRYPGPKPQSKEAGLVMVADVTEAATRSLNEPSPESIREMVQKLTTSIYSDGQLDESGMTFNDLNFIEKTFTKMLLSIHHHRISYPELKVNAQQASPPTGNRPHRLAKRRVSS